jgi:8-oxo-dGTP pyrophosphatase MutT (NUDIX family)
MNTTDHLVRQAGAIAFKATAGGPVILLVKAKKNPSHWIFPKGHVEPGESDEQAALRELCEEAGIKGEPLCRAGETEYNFGGLRYHVVYFLSRYIASQGPGEDGREPRWCSLEEALRLLSFPDMRAMLKGMVPFMREGMQSPPQ